MKYKLEKYKGIAINAVEKIIGTKKYVVATWKIKTKPYSTKGTTKIDAVTKAKQVIDRIL